MKAKEIRDMTIEDLRTKESDLNKDLFMLKVQNVSRQIENPMRIRQARIDIARVKTILKEKGKRE
ncbi:MAG: 50S ribosomal protein L29 [Deltaproteobacteria bacterium GWC2_42_11]|nr:MAG: 50S ribosomal protein L29 [Deltaproteobacteria bacterium GWC2_42_11]HBO85228.1 50S ribosomal protein L29 [Deltaproteobacteria bacterium]